MVKMMLLLPTLPPTIIIVETSAPVCRCLAGREWRRLGLGPDVVLGRRLWESCLRLAETSAVELVFELELGLLLLLWSISLMMLVLLVLSSSCWSSSNLLHGRRWASGHEAAVRRRPRLCSALRRAAG